MPQNRSWNIQLASRQDVPEMLEIYAPFIQDMSVSFEMDLPSEAAYWERVEKVLAEAPWLVCRLGRDMAGFAYSGKHRIRPAYRFTREISVYVHPGFRRRGVASSLYTALLQIMQEQGYANALAGITLPNPGSVAFHESMGFKKIGVYHNIGFKFGQFHDVGWWEMFLNADIDGNIKPLHNVFDSAGWQKSIDKGLQVFR